jgi:altronate dehydratase
MPVVASNRNGSITNFPFVPTVKVLTTSVRYELLSKDMDVNAGTYLDGTQTMDELGQDTYAFILKAASGKRTRGELAGHHQVRPSFNCTWRMH